MLCLLEAKVTESQLAILEGLRPGGHLCCDKRQHCFITSTSALPFPLLSQGKGSLLKPTALFVSLRVSYALHITKKYHFVLGPSLQLHGRHEQHSFFPERHSFFLSFHRMNTWVRIAGDHYIQRRARTNQQHRERRAGPVDGQDRSVERTEGQDRQVLVSHSRPPQVVSQAPTSINSSYLR